MTLSIFLFIFFLFVCMVIGGLIGWIIANHNTNKKILHAQEQAQQNNQQFTQMMEGISARALQHNSNSYLQQTDLHLKNVLSPLAQHISKLEEHIQQMEQKRTGAYQSLHGTVNQLSNEILTLQKSNQTLQTSTENLNQALRSDHTTRGKWGEIQLRRIVEIAGMKEHIDFEEQAHLSQGEKTLRPDMIIRMPQSGIIPVDAKAPMNAYLQACDAKTPEESKYYLEQHKKALENHINTLSKKEYWNIESHNTTPQLVIMFVPYESGIEASLSHDPYLLDKALSHKVIVTGPSSLYALLKVISYGWMQVSLTKNTEEIYKICKELFGRFNIFYGHFSKIGNQLNNAVESFNKASGSLQQRFLPTLKQINTLQSSHDTIPNAEDIPIIDSRAKENLVEEKNNDDE